MSQSFEQAIQAPNFLYSKIKGQYPHRFIVAYGVDPRDGAVVAISNYKTGVDEGIEILHKHGQVLGAARRIREA